MIQANSTVADPQSGEADKQDSFGLPDVEKMAREELGGYAPYERILAFVLAFCHHREVDRHLRDLSGMRKDSERLGSWLASGASSDLQRAAWTATRMWLDEERQRHEAAISRLRGELLALRKTDKEVAISAERRAVPTFGKWLKVVRL